MSTDAVPPTGQRLVSVAEMRALEQAAFRARRRAGSVDGDRRLGRRAGPAALARLRSRREHTIWPVLAAHPRR